MDLFGVEDMYSKNQKEKAVKLFIKYEHSHAAVMRELGSWVFWHFV